MKNFQNRHFECPGFKLNNARMNAYVSGGAVHVVHAELHSPLNLI